MNFIDIVSTYFRGERLEALLFIFPAGIIAVIVAGAAIWSYKDGFGFGLGIPLGLVGLALVFGGLWLGLKTPNQVRTLEQSYQENQTTTVQNEIQRMEKVNTNWPRLIGMWTALVVVGLGLRLGMKADAAHGIGLALILIGAIGFQIDAFAERRAHPYAKALHSLLSK